MKLLRRIGLSINILFICVIMYFLYVLTIPISRAYFTWIHIKKSLVEIWSGQFDIGAPRNRTNTYPTDIKNEGMK